MWQYVPQVQSLISIVFYVFGMIGVAIAYASLVANRQNQREANARRAYLDYARLGMEYPGLAFPLHLDLNLDERTVGGNRQDFEKYEWFVSIMLGTVRFFLESTQADMWRQMMILQLAYHWEYLDRFRNKKEYLKRSSVELGSEIDEGIALGRRLYPRLQVS